MAFDFVSRGRLLTVALILAPGALFPAVGRRNGGYGAGVIISAGELIGRRRLLAFSRLRVNLLGRDETHRSHQDK
jgi:hypothetical protein